MITLESIKAQQADLAKSIALLESRMVVKTIDVPGRRIDLVGGELYAGRMLDSEGKPSHDLILLPEQAEGVSWKSAMAWAEEVGGSLPTRAEQSMLFANLKGQFAQAAYWSSEQFAGDESDAWFQHFGDGFQYYCHKCSELRARAVRRLPL